MDAAVFGADVGAGAGAGADTGVAVDTGVYDGVDGAAGAGVYTGVYDVVGADVGVDVTTGVPCTFMRPVYACEYASVPYFAMSAGSALILAYRSASSWLVSASLPASVV